MLDAGVSVGLDTGGHGVSHSSQQGIWRAPEVRATQMHASALLPTFCMSKTADGDFAV